MPSSNISAKHQVASLVAIVTNKTTISIVELVIQLVNVLVFAHGLLSTESAGSVGRNSNKDKDGRAREAPEGSQLGDRLHQLHAQTASILLNIDWLLQRVWQQGTAITM